MRLIRLILILALAVALVLLALANRGAVTLNLFPAQFGQYLGGQWSLTLPLFLVVFLALAAGMVLGLIWEYLREASIRAEARRADVRANRLQHEVRSLRKAHDAPHDEVLAIVDAPTAKPATQAPALMDSRS
ncbi:MAG: LapA family protein [Paracoccus sp. (in: a-proteobacteria)]|uniref:LapA family protein n=1 Tax=Paracoccus sp. TaxID=267 RepID=UPI0026E04046|nr:LapA family protein [Paracoccus sp. (in: a-proteobacteria)]MDO5621274.1 LapA family protein [Paracoccus sp. (in: a-proteobacteria)]